MLAETNKELGICFRSPHCVGSHCRSCSACVVWAPARPGKLNIYDLPAPGAIEVVLHQTSCQVEKKKRRVIVLAAVCGAAAAWALVALAIVVRAGP